MSIQSVKQVIKSIGPVYRTARLRSVGYGVGTACHTATLTGQQHIPRLAGQHREYLAAQRGAFKASTRGSSMA